MKLLLGKKISLLGPFLTKKEIESVASISRHLLLFLNNIISILKNTYLSSAVFWYQRTRALDGRPNHHNRWLTMLVCHTKVLKGNENRESPTYPNEIYFFYRMTWVFFQESLNCSVAFVLSAELVLCDKLHFMHIRERLHGLKMDLFFQLGSLLHTGPKLELKRSTLLAPVSYSFLILSFLLNTSCGTLEPWEISIFPDSFWCNMYI